MQAFHRQGLDPLGDRERRHLSQACGTGQFHLGVHQPVIALVEAWRHLQDHLGNALAVDAGDGSIVLLDDVQDDAVIGGVLIMVVAFPVAGAHVYLDVAHPQVAVNFYLGIKEVGTRVGVEQARVDDAHLAPVVGHHVLTQPQLVLPDVLQEPFHS